MGTPESALRPRWSSKPLLLWAALAVAVLFTYLAVRNVRLGDVWETFRAGQALWLVPALAAMTGAFFLRALRWQSLFAPGRAPRLGAVTRALFLGYLFNNVLPLRAGEAVRIASLNRRSGRPLAEVAATAVVERVFDLLSLLVLLFVLTPWLPDVTWLRTAALLAPVLALAVGAAVVALAVWGARPVEALVATVGRIPYVPAERLTETPLNLVAGLAGLRTVRVGLVAFGLTTLSWLVLGLGFWLVMVSLDLELSALAGPLVVIAVGLAMILPSPPAALGVFEGATVVAVEAYGVAGSPALSYALLLHALNFLPFVAIAGAGLALRAVRYRRASRSRT